MNEIINNFLFTEGKFKPKVHLKRDLFIVLLNHLIKNKQTKKKKDVRYKIWYKIWNVRYIYQNKPENECFYHDMA